MSRERITLVRLLLVEDDARMRALVGAVSTSTATSSRRRSTGPEAVRDGRRPEFDAIVLDVMLPGLMVSGRRAASRAWPPGHRC